MNKLKLWILERFYFRALVNGYKEDKRKYLLKAEGIGDMIGEWVIRRMGYKKAEPYCSAITELLKRGIYGFEKRLLR